MIGVSIKVDRVKSPDEVQELTDLGISKVTLSLGDAIPDDRTLNRQNVIQIFKHCPNTVIGIKVTPTYEELSAIEQIVSVCNPKYIQIDYSQITTPAAKILRERFSKIAFVADSIIADSDIEIGWIKDQVSEARSLGYEEVVLDIYGDRQNSWGDILNAVVGEELTLDEIKNIPDVSKAFLSSDFPHQEIGSLSTILPFGLNIKLSEKFEPGHYQSYTSCFKFILDLKDFGVIIS